MIVKGFIVSNYEMINHLYYHFIWPVLKKIYDNDGLLHTATRYKIELMNDKHDNNVDYPFVGVKWYSGHHISFFVLFEHVDYTSPDTIKSSVLEIYTTHYCNYMGRRNDIRCELLD